MSAIELGLFIRGEEDNCTRMVDYHSTLSNKLASSLACIA